MNKFKIGDKVKVTRLLDVTKGGSEYIGQIFTIENIYEGETYKYDLGYKNNYAWADYELELVEPAEPAHKVDCTITENFMNEWKRMCKTGSPCADCPLHNSNNSVGLLCSVFVKYHTAEAIAIVQKWSDEHPEKPPKTIKDDLLEKYPNAKMIEDYPKVCAYHLGYLKDICHHNLRDCKKCWKTPLEEAQK